ncbi:NOL1/NOP2/sun domain protein [Metarhizium album ARSEF 1941]|uniref:NOL1/NOP2/sun domain protein n=1 Tax=Metarhizium album (strain ARSEF 1941) TaxID=1081103 RepID=A0A0B2WQ94_METAS|nr:NOL1/NOP2/sun domain protein [Metarhizium album ARSEF 1941]KHN95165.1 NOL1/NOP2/sun domain protein [Metarhizium album ARSEF 1941]
MSLYHEAADVLSASPQEGGSLKARVFRRKGVKSSPNQLYALVSETWKWSAVLKELTPALALLLVHDLLLAKGGIALPQSHGLRSSVERHKARLGAEFTRARLRRGAPSVELLAARVERAAAGEEAAHPRWVRVNALRSTLEEQLETTFAGFSRAATVREVLAGEGRHVLVDPHVPNLVAVTPRCDLSRTEAYGAGKIILQDKASCFPACLLDPGPEDGDVIDACAAPGNKTTHLAAVMRSREPGSASRPQTQTQTIFAFEKDAGRARTLEKMVRVAASDGMTRVAAAQDFLRVDPESERFRAVGALLLDPSCSGSGIVGRDSMPQLHLPDSGRDGARPGRPRQASAGGRKRKHEQVQGSGQAVIRDDDGNETIVKSEKDVAERLKALAAFQLAVLLHAFRFPSARKVTYSTCSVHPQENEDVVMAALNSDIAKERGWRILRRSDQVAGMKAWPVRGSAEACIGDEEVAQGCIRSYKGDGHGTMGFFVAGFVRDTTTEDGDGGGPYVRNQGGAMVRDVLGMPGLRAAGTAVPLVCRGGDASQEGSAIGSDESRGGGGGGGGGTKANRDGDDAEESEWEGLGD